MLQPKLLPNVQLPSELPQLLISHQAPMPIELCWGWLYIGLFASCLMFLPDVLFLLNSIYC